MLLSKSPVDEAAKIEQSPFLDKYLLLLKIRAKNQNSAATMSTSTLPQFPDFKVSLSMFENVSNGKELRSQVAGLPFAFVDAKMICSMEQIYSAIYRALVETSYNRMRTKSLHSECLLCLSPSSNIGEAFRIFGIKDDSDAVIVVQILNGQHPAQKVCDFIKGNEVELSDSSMQKHYDEGLIRKVYKLDQNFHEMTVKDLSRALVNAIQLRGL